MERGGGGGEKVEGQRETGPGAGGGGGGREYRGKTRNVGRGRERGDRENAGERWVGEKKDKGRERNRSAGRLEEERRGE